MNYIDPPWLSWWPSRGARLAVSLEGAGDFHLRRLRERDTLLGCPGKLSLRGLMTSESPSYVKVFLSGIRWGNGRVAAFWAHPNARSCSRGLDSDSWKLQTRGGGDPVFALHLASIQSVGRDAEPETSIDVSYLKL